MEYIRTFEEFNLVDLFKKKDDNNNNEINNVPSNFIFMTNNLENILLNIKGNLISDVFLALKYIDEEKLLPIYANYLDVDKTGAITYLDSKYIESEQFNREYFIHPRRQGIRVSKALGKILKPEFLPNDQVELEKFMNAWKAMLDSKLRVEELVGNDILKAFDTKNVKDSGGSCAVGSHCSKFTGLIKNPNNYSVFVVWEKNDFGDEGIIGRRVGIKGIQTKTFGAFKEGVEYSLLNNFYGRGGTKSATDMFLLNYAKNSGFQYAMMHYGEGPINLKTMRELDREKDIFRVKIENPMIGGYPSFDRLFINFYTGEVTSYKTGKDNGFVDMYGARPPVF